MSGCTAPRQGHRTASGRANCPVCRYRSSYRPSYPTYSPTVTTYRPSGGGSSGGGGGGGARTTSRRTRSGGTATYTPAEERTFEPLARQAVAVARTYPDRRDIFLCHAWDDRQAAAKELYDLLRSYGATV